MSPPRLSLVIPVFNEEENLPPLAAEIEAALAPTGLPYEVIWVDDGSTDGSLEVMKALARDDFRVRVLHLTRNSGQSAAFDAGFRHARGELLATLDADLQNDPADIPRLLEHLEGHDVVNGVREKRHDNWLRRISSRIANGVRNRATGESVTDVGCTLRVLRREYAERIFLFDGLHRFLPTLLKMAGARVCEVPVGHRPRLYGEPKYNIRNRMFKALVDLFAVRWMQKRWIDRGRVEELRVQPEAVLPEAAAPTLLPDPRSEC